MGVRYAAANDSVASAGARVHISVYEVLSEEAAPQQKEGLANGRRENLGSVVSLSAVSVASSAASDVANTCYSQ